MNKYPSVILNDPDFDKEPCYSLRQTAQQQSIGNSKTKERALTSKKGQKYLLMKKTNLSLIKGKV